jgi:hypothetical protein
MRENTKSTPQFHFENQTEEPMKTLQPSRTRATNYYAAAFFIVAPAQGEKLRDRSLIPGNSAVGKIWQRAAK